MSFFRLFQLLNNILSLPDAPLIYFLKHLLWDNEQLAVPHWAVIYIPAERSPRVCFEYGILTMEGFPLENKTSTLIHIGCNVCIFTMWKYKMTPCDCAIIVVAVCVQMTEINSCLCNSYSDHYKIPFCYLQVTKMCNGIDSVPWNHLQITNGVC